MKITKLLVLVLVISLLGALFTGCSGSSPADSKGVVVNFWSIWNTDNGNGAYLKAAADKFNAANSGITVNIYGQGGYDGVAEKLEAAIIANNTPTIAQTEESFLARFHTHAADLSKYLSKKTIDNYLPGLLASSYADGALKAVPLNRSTPLLYLNEDLLKKAGLDTAGPKTWDELVEYAKKIHSLGNDIYGFTAYWDSDAWYWESNLYAYGGEVLNEDATKVAFNTEAGWKIIDLWQKMTKDGVMLNPYGVQEGKSGFMNAKFKEGKVGMMLDSVGGLSKVRDTSFPFKINVAYQPKGTKNALVSGGANVIILTDATEAQKKAAGKFLDYLAQDEFAVGFSMTSGYFVTTKSGMESDECKKLFSEYPQYKIALDQTQFIHARPTHRNWREMYIALTEELEAAMLQPDKDPKEVMKTAAERCQKIIDDNKY